MRSPRIPPNAWIVLSVLSAYCLVLSASLVLQAHAEELRDPFTFGPRAGQTARTQLALMGVLCDATRPLAILGEEMVAVGDTVAGWRVVEIRQEGIMVQRDERRQFVTPGTSLPPD